MSFELNDRIFSFISIFQPFDRTINQNGHGSKRFVFFPLFDETRLNRKCPWKSNTFSYYRIGLDPQIPFLRSLEQWVFGIYARLTGSECWNANQLGMSTIGWIPVFDESAAKY